MSRHQMVTTIFYRALRDNKTVLRSARRLLYRETQIVRFGSLNTSSSIQKMGDSDGGDANSSVKLSSDSDEFPVDGSGKVGAAKLLELLTDILKLRDTPISNWIIESRSKILCNTYRCSSGEDRQRFLVELAQQYTVDQQKLNEIFNRMNDSVRPCDDVQMFKYEEKLRHALVPQYHWLFLHIGRVENGVKFLVDLRTEVRNMLQELDKDDIKSIKLQQLNATLIELLSLWFSVGFLTLQRITWKSSCEMLEKISEYETVHPIRNWTDLKRRVGPYRRCFVFTHSSMPDEPLVVLHTALSDRIHSSMSSITANARRMSRFTSVASTVSSADNIPEIAENIKAAVFYSVTSTQDGLHGIELGNYLIKSVVSELISEFPCITQFSTLSPIPKFKKWLYEKLKTIEKDNQLVGIWFAEEEVKCLTDLLGTDNICGDLRKRFNNNEWLEDNVLVKALEVPLMRLCAYYLYVEKRRGGAFDSVAHFHLRNGATMWRLNWLADTSARGLTNSCGLMINYRYMLNDAEVNSRRYIENYEINASEQILKLLEFFKERNLIK